MRITLQSTLLTLIVLATATLATRPAMAQSKLDVPFSFMAGGNTYPAGTYSVTRDPVTGTVALKGAKNMLTFMASMSGNAHDNAKESLTFERIGGVYYLRTMQIGRFITPQFDKKARAAGSGLVVASLDR